MVRALEDGELRLFGRIAPASNATYYAEAVLDGLLVPCVYKPIAGERPLWDFPHGTLAEREIAAYVVSLLLDWDVVPVTILRDGPQGQGMVQLWQEAVPDVDAVDLCPPARVPPGFRHVLDARDPSGRPVALVHEDSEPLRRMAVFDAVINNADRKGGHVLAMADGHRYGVDHGVCFHEEDKLRTVLWGWAGERLLPEHRDAVAALADRLEGDRGVRDVFARLLTGDEVDALVARCRRLVRCGRMPNPSDTWPSIPWPAF